MSNASFENEMEEELLYEVSLLTPEDADKAMDLLKQNIVEHWWRRIEWWLKGINRSGNYDAPWTEAYKAIQLLEQNPGPETLAELGANPSEGFTRRVIAQLWDILEEDQQKRVLRSIKRGIALHGLEYFFDALLDFLRREASQKEGDAIAKQILKKAYEFNNGKISFDELMNSIAELMSSHQHSDASAISKLFTEVKTLGHYINSNDLKKLVMKLYSLTSSL